MTPRLTARQSEVAALLTLGMSSKMIARKLGIAEGTVKVHTRSLFAALGVKNRTQAAILLIGGLHGNAQAGD